MQKHTQLSRDDTEESGLSNHEQTIWITLSITPAVSEWVWIFINGAKLAKQSQRRRTNGDEPPISSSVDYCWNRWALRWCLKEHSVIIWSSMIDWQTVPCSWSIDGKTALTGSSPGARDQLYSAETWSVTEVNQKCLEDFCHNSEKTAEYINRQSKK